MGLTAGCITAACKKHFINFDYQLENTYVFEWESDFFCISRDRGYMYEVEVKISRADFKADFKKSKHELMLRACAGEKIYTVPSTLKEYGVVPGYGRVQLYSGLNYCRPANLLPNCFYYAVPDGLIKQDELPKYAGLIYYDKKSRHLTVIKKAPYLHKQNNTLRKRAILFDKFYYKYQSLERATRFSKHESKQRDQAIKFLEQVVKAHGIDPLTGKKPDFEADNPNALVKYTQFLFKKLGQKEPTYYAACELIKKFNGSLPEIPEDLNLNSPVIKEIFPTEPGNIGE